MGENISRYQESFKIRASEVDLKGEATLASLCSLFQEVAGNHALQLNFDISQLHEQGLTWVLHRMDIQIDDYPKWRDEITIETWPAAGDALRAYRDYRIMNAQGEAIGCCLSYWMMINMKTRRPTRMPQEVLDLRLKELDHVLPVKNDRLRPFDANGQEKSFTVRYSDLDMNQHVNNARYVDWMMEAIPDSISRKVHRMDLTFLQESVAGDQVITQKKETEEDLLRLQLIKKSGEVLALANCSFGPPS